MAPVAAIHEEIHAAMEAWMNFYEPHDNGCWGDAPILCQNCLLVKNGRASIGKPLCELVGIKGFEGDMNYVNVRYRIVTASKSAAVLNLKITNDRNYDGGWLFMMHKTRDMEWQIVTKARTEEGFEEREDDVIGETIDSEYGRWEDESGEEEEDKKQKAVERRRLRRQRKQREKRLKRSAKAERSQQRRQRHEERRQRKE